MANICVFTAVCEDDAFWVDQYLAEIDRLKLPFVIYLDRCSVETKQKLKNHTLCVGAYEQDDHTQEFHEARKQKLLDLIPKQYEWALAWDIDETWECRALEKLENLPDADYIDVTWVNLWEDDQHIRVGDGFGPRPRTKLYSMKNPWKFTSPVVNGPYLHEKKDQVAGRIELVCIHHGLKTKQLREQHKERWDRIYTKATGSNPYKLWETAVDETITPNVQPNPYETC